jgi:transposase-like protein
MERSERTAQGYKRFRCRTCGKQFNERTGNPLNRTNTPPTSSPSWCSGGCATS